MGKRKGFKKVCSLIFIAPTMPLLTFTPSQSGRGGGPQRDRDRQPWTSVGQENELLERLYSESGIIPDNEKKEFWEAMRRDLPSSFRFTGSRGYVTAVWHYCS